MRRSRWPAICIMTLLTLLLVLTGCPNEPEPNEPDPEPQAVQTPTFLPQGGEYFGILTVYLACPTSGAEIYYTTDGTDPNQTDSALYTSSGVTIDATCTLKARGFKDGMTESHIGSMDYTILAVPSQVPTPVLEGSASGVHVPGPYPVQVYPSCTLGPVVFVYTTDGTDPVPNATDPELDPANGDLWTGGYLTVTRRTTIKVIAAYVGTAPGVADSEIATGFYDVFGSTVSVGNALSDHSALCIDAVGKHHLVYWSDPVANQSDRLMYTTDAGGSWLTTPELIYSVGAVTDMNWQWMAIGVTSNGDVHVVAMQNIGGGLRHFVRSFDGMDWSWSGPITVDSTEATTLIGSYVSMAIDPTKDDPEIVYYDAISDDPDNSGLKYGRFHLGTWSTLSLNEIGHVGEYSSLALDSNGELHASCYDATGTLIYTTSVDDSWGAKDTGGVGKWSSIAVDGNDKVHISYFDEGNGDLKYATNAPSGTWSVETVDSTGTTGLFTSIAVTADGIPCITYYSDTGSGPTYYNLWYAVKPSMGWFTKELAHGTTKYAHVVVDNSGYAGIAYPGKFLKDGP